MLLKSTQEYKFDEVIECEVGGLNYIHSRDWTYDLIATTPVKIDGMWTIIYTVYIHP